MKRRYRAEVDVGEGVWYTNSMRFDTLAEAQAYAQDLAFRWTLVRTWRSVEDTTPMREPVAA